MAYKISSTTVIDNDRNINITGITTALSFSGKGMVEAGTVCYFFQASAPTGFTKLTANDDCALRVVSGTASTGGTTGFSNVFPAPATFPIVSPVTTGNTTLTIPQLPSHTHPNSVIFNSPPLVGGTIASPLSGATQTTTSGSTGGGGSHTHPDTPASTSIDMRVQYIDVIAASRDS